MKKTKPGTFNAKHVRAQIRIHKERQSKTGCRNYAYPEQYAECVHKYTTSTMMKHIGCIPPYFLFNKRLDEKRVCQGNVTINKDAVNILDKFKYQVRLLLYSNIYDCMTLIQNSLYQINVSGLFLKQS